MTCLKVDHLARHVFVGTRDGLVQGYLTSNFAPATRVITMSSYSVNNIEIHRHLKDTYLIVGFASGQVSMFKSLDQQFRITQDPRRDSFTI